jgi:hypothetical protein
MKCRSIMLFLFGWVPVLCAQSYTFTSLSVPFAGATQTRAVGINDLGAITGWYIDSRSLTHGFFPQGFVLENRQYTPLGFPGASTTSPAGINLRGEIVRVYSSAAGVPHGFLLKGSVLRPLTFPVPSQLSLPESMIAARLLKPIGTPADMNTDFLGRGFTSRRLTLPFQGRSIRV